MTMRKTLTVVCKALERPERMEAPDRVGERKKNNRCRAPILLGVRSCATT